MNLQDVADELRTALDTVPGLTVPAWGTKSSGLPAGLIGWPESVEFTATYARGKARIRDWPVVIVVSANNTRKAWETLSDFLTDQPGGVVAALEGGTYTEADFVHVSSADLVEGAKYDSKDVIAAILHCDINGPGK